MLFLRGISGKIVYHTEETTGRRERVDDRQLMASIAGGDEAALQALLRRFTPLFLYVLRPILPDERDREECLADISLRIWQGAGSFDGAKGA